MLGGGFSLWCVRGFRYSAMSRCISGLGIRRCFERPWWNHSQRSRGSGWIIPELNDTWSWFQQGISKRRVSLTHSVISQKTFVSGDNRAAFSALRLSLFFCSFRQAFQNGLQTTSIQNILKKEQINALLYLWCILFTQFSPTCFGRHSGHLQGDVLIKDYKNTNFVIRVTITA